MSSLAKITLSGEVKTSPEKRYTESNLAITTFMMDFGYDNQEKQIKALAFGKIADRVADTVKKGQVVIIDGRLQTSVKNESGVEKKVNEINIQGIEIVGSPDRSNTQYQGADELESEVNRDDLIGEEEIPF